ncbi:MAG: M48 family metallopeptidase [Bacteroidetes bacterium]|nr:M48 family metallopeptidase [Bacteroidota bacterium]
MSKVFYIFLLCVLLGKLNGQYNKDFEKNYTPLISKGNLPKELNLIAFEKAKNLTDTLNPKAQNHKINKDFYTLTTFSEDEILKSGNVLYNTEVNDYINKIADVLLQNEPVLKSKLKFYVLRENLSNAFAWDNGHIYISLDYIARYNTEAQLAMTLSHEIIHYLKSHQYSGYRKRNEIIKQLSGKLNNDTIWKQEREFSKAQESEADMEGFELLKKSGYNTNGIPEKFDLMLLSDYSFENTPFETDYFNNQYLKINPAIFYQEVKPVNIDANYDDTWDTHPNIYKRKKAIEEKISSQINTEGKDFIVSKDEFYRVRDICRFETILCNIKDFELETCVYHCYCLLKKYPQNIFLKNIIAEVFYQIAVYKSYRDINGGVFDYINLKDNDKTNSNRDSTMGHVAQTKKMFERLNGEDFLLLAINQNYKLYKESNFSEQQLKTNLDTLFNILSKVHNLNYRDFHKNETEYNQRTIYVNDSISKNRKFVDAIYRQSAFIHYMNDKEFISFFKDTSSVNEFGLKYISKGRLGKIPDPDIKYKKYTAYNKEEIKKISKIIMLDPYFEKEMYKIQDVESFPIDAYNNAIYFKTELTKAFEKEKVQVFHINDSRFDTSETEKYNHVALINNIISENDMHYKLSSMRTFATKSEGVIETKYGTPYVVQVTANETIYDNVIFLVNGIKVLRDIKMFEYCMDIVNVEKGITVYRISLEQSRKVTEEELKIQIDSDIKNILTIKNN